MAYRTVANGRPVDINWDATPEPIRSFLQSLPDGTIAIMNAPGLGGGEIAGWQECR
jgi:hypothetical protein